VAARKKHNGRADKKSDVNPDLEAVIERKLKDLLEDDGGEKFSLTDWAKVVDRALALEKVKHAVKEEEIGAAFEE
jgi:hypothetical protein